MLVRAMQPQGHNKLKESWLEQVPGLGKVNYVPDARKTELYLSRLYQGHIAPSITELPPSKVVKIDLHNTLNKPDFLPTCCLA